MADYITGAEFLKRYDWRDVGDLCDDGNSQVAEDDIPDDPNFLACVGDASADIDAALLVGGRYSTDELEALTGNGLKLLYRMCAELTMYYLLARRPAYDEEKLKAYESIRERHLERLESGNNIFNLTETVAATKAQVDHPSAVEYDNLGLLRDRIRNYYPARTIPRP